MYGSWLDPGGDAGIVGVFIINSIFIISITTIIITIILITMALAITITITVIDNHVDLIPKFRNHFGR